MVATGIRDWCANQENRRLIERLKRRSINPRAEERGARLKEQTVVVTGALQSMTRDEVKQAIWQQGGKSASRVSGSTAYLVVGKNPGKTKRAEAERLGVATLGEKEFLSRIGKTIS
jgi:DNA ligase (NAD+)